MKIATKALALIAAVFLLSLNMNWSSDPMSLRAASMTSNRTPVHEGQFFDITQPNSPPFQPGVTLSVPAGTVLTDAHVTFSVPESVPNAAALFISDGSKTLVYQIVNNTTFSAGLDLESGITSTGSLIVQLSCYNIAGNHCQGAIMWSGYTLESVKPEGDER
jgi:hypothetical protein